MYSRKYNLIGKNKIYEILLIRTIAQNVSETYFIIESEILSPFLIHIRPRISIAQILG